jgi:hypothetical protein
MKKRGTADDAMMMMTMENRESRGGGFKSFALRP